VAPPEVTFYANDTYRHFTFIFKPRPTNSEHESTQGSYLALPLALLIFVAITNHSRLLPFANKMFELLTVLANPTAQNREDAAPGSNNGNTASTANPNSAPFDAGAVAALRKKIKARKIQ